MYSRLRRYPFGLICHSLLGRSALVADASVPSQAIGRAGIRCDVNGAKGNLIVEDRILSFPDTNKNISFSYLYNSQVQQSASAWRLAFGRQLTSIQVGVQMTVIEADGKAVIYLYDAGNKIYRASQYDEGIPHVAYDEVNKIYYFYHPKLQETDVFNADGRLLKQLDDVGNQTIYEYDGEKLKAIVAPSGTRYEFDYQNNQTEIYVNNNQKRQLLHTYQFDAKQRLLKSITADQYETAYQYDTEKENLFSISQTDQTYLQFDYHQEGKLKQLQWGKNQEAETFNFNYETASTRIQDHRGARKPW